jgi:predicted negative regulator of RcsB-dependent stress response
LVSDYQSTPYAGLAALALAKLDYDAGDKAGAEKQLRIAMDKARDDAVRHAATLRLARLMLDAGKTDEALSLADTKDNDGFESEYAELRGDILLAKGDRAGAQSAYQQAVKALKPESPYLPLLTMKLDDTGGATP